MDIKIAPSLLAADSSRLADEVKSVEKLGVNFLHIDVMDGHFVPNISIGPAIIKDLRRHTDLPFEAHLMIERPLKYIERFVEAGADIITLHIETISAADFRRQARSLHKRGLRLAIALNPRTPAAKIKSLADSADMVLLMTVHPGFGGQKFMYEVVPKIAEVRSFYKGDIAVDGGVNDKNAIAAVRAGANVLACGSYIFKAKDKKKAIERLKCLR